MSPTAQTLNPKYVRFPNGETYKYETGLWQTSIAKGECESLNDRNGRAARVSWLRIQLLEFIKPKSTIKIICTHAAASGMSHRFIVLIPIATDSGLIIINRTRDIAELCGLRINKHDEIVMGGCGYSKSFQIVYDLGHALWPQGTPKPHGVRNGEPDSDGGYALSHN